MRDVNTSNAVSLYCPAVAQAPSVRFIADLVQCKFGVTNCSTTKQIEPEACIDVRVKLSKSVIYSATLYSN